MKFFKFLIIIIFLYIFTFFRIDDNPIKSPYYTKDINGKLLFMRHGETNFNRDKDLISRRVNQIYIDCKLNWKGIKQAISKQKILNSLNLEQVYVSPFYRALQTLTYSLKNYPNKNNITAIVHPFVSEISNCVNDYILDIKQTKNDFNMNSTIKIDWTLFDEYVKTIKYDENFYYFDFLDCFNEKEKNEVYLKIKNYYDKGDINNLKMGLVNLSDLRFKKKIRFESLKHAQERFIQFSKYILKKHKNSLDNNNKKIFVFSHSSFMTVVSNMTRYSSKKVQRFNKGYGPKNCEIICFPLALY